MLNSWLGFIVGICLISCLGDKVNAEQNSREVINNKKVEKMDTITLGAGCFWCVEAIFQDINGVASVESGYSGGNTTNPTYKEVCSGKTGHAEVCQLVYDPNVVSFEKLMEVFFQTHDPTTLNRQGADVGSQYRSAVFYHSEEQRVRTVEIINKLNNSGAFENSIVTEVTAFETFYPAENYHQDYFNLNGEQPYCRAVVAPKVDKFKKAFSDILK